MKPALRLAMVGFLFCGCATVERPASRIAGSEQLSQKWKSASIEEHALVLSTLKIADESPDTYRTMIANAKRNRATNGREILKVSGGEICPNHEYILNRKAGTFKQVVTFNVGEDVSHMTTIHARGKDGWYFAEFKIGAEGSTPDPSSSIRSKSK